MLYRVTLKYACFGVEDNDNRVIIHAADIAKWAVGKRFIDFAKWVASKRGQIEQLT